MTPSSLPTGSQRNATDPGEFPVLPAPDSAADEPFVDRRQNPESGSGARERRQFGSSHRELSDDGRELALAIDQYKVERHRRYLTCDELLSVISELGYHR